MDSKSAKVAVVGGNGHGLHEKLAEIAKEAIIDAGKTTLAEKIQDKDDWSEAEMLDYIACHCDDYRRPVDPREDFRSARDARSQRLINDMYTGKHRASTMYGITRGRKSNTSFKANNNKNFQRTKH